jgi:hypothetical protein
MLEARMKLDGGAEKECKYRGDEEGIKIEE